MWFLQHRVHCLHSDGLEKWGGGWDAHGKQGSQCPFTLGGSGSSLSCRSFLTKGETFCRNRTPRKFLSHRPCCHLCQASKQCFIKGRGSANGVEVSNVPTHLPLPLWAAPRVPHKPWLMSPEARSARPGHTPGSLPEEPERRGSCSERRMRRAQPHSHPEIA